MHWTICRKCNEVRWSEFNRLCHECWGKQGAAGRQRSVKAAVETYPDSEKGIRRIFARLKRRIR